MSEWGTWSSFPFAPMAQSGEEERSYRGVFSIRRPGFFAFDVAIRNAKYPNEIIVGTSLDYYIQAISLQDYYLEFTLRRDMLCDEGNILRVTAEASDVTSLVPQALQQYLLSFSLVRPATYQIDPASGNGEFTRESEAEGAGGHYNRKTNNFSLASYRMFYDGFQSRYENPSLNRVPLGDWIFHGQNLSQVETTPFAISCYLRLNEREADFDGYGEEKYEAGSPYRLIPLTLETYRENNVTYSHLLLKDVVAISKDGRRVKKASEAGANDLLTRNVYLPPLSTGESAVNYDFHLVLEGCGEYHFDTIEATIPITKTHNLVGACSNSDWCVEEI